MNLWRPVVQELKDTWPAIEVDSPAALAKQATDILNGKAPVASIQEVGSRLLERSGGAVECTVAFLRRHLDVPNTST